MLGVNQVNSFDIHALQFVHYVLVPITLQLFTFLIFLQVFSGELNIFPIRMYLEQFSIYVTNDI